MVQINSASKRKQVKQIKLNVPLRGHRAGAIISVAFVGAVPNSRYWRDRMIDSKIDNCIEVVENNKQDSREED